MKIWLVIIHIVLVGSSVWASIRVQYDGASDNEFAEFEEFDTYDDEQTEFIKEKPDKEPEKAVPDPDFQREYDVEDVLIEVSYRLGVGCKTCFNLI